MEDIETLRDFELFFEKQGSVDKLVRQQEPWAPGSVNTWKDLATNEQIYALESALSAVASMRSDTTPPGLETQPRDERKESRIQNLV